MLESSRQSCSWIVTYISFVVFRCVVIVLGMYEYLYVGTTYQYRYVNVLFLHGMTCSLRFFLRRFSPLAEMDFYCKVPVADCRSTFQ